MWSYAEIKKIRYDLYSLLSATKNMDIGLGESEINHFKDSIKQYDVVLERIGEGGFNKDRDLEKAFYETEELISNIRQALIPKGISF